MHIKGYFNEIQGGMAFDPDGVDADQILVLLPTDSLATNWSFIDNMLMGESFFDTRNYPDILFFSTGFYWSTPVAAKLTGQLTLHGVTRTVDFDVELTDTGGRHASGTERIRVTASTTIRRSDFGMDALQTVVDDSVELCMEIEATQHRHHQSESTPAAGNDTASGFNE
jgi:polyisoprenoid-binding protein YceI